MSFLSILLFASAFYVAQAKPQGWSTVWDIAQAANNYVPFVPQIPSIPILGAASNQDQYGGVTAEVGEAVDQYMTPMMSPLDPATQDKLKAMGIKVFSSYMDYLRLLLQEKELENANNGDEEEEEEDEDTGVPSEPRDEEKGKKRVEFDTFSQTYPMESVSSYKISYAEI